MTRTEIFEHLKRAMVELFELPAEKITLQSKLKDDLDLDSIDAIDMAARLHELTGRRLEFKSLVKIETVSDVVDVVEAHLSSG